MSGNSSRLNIREPWPKEDPCNNLSWNSHSRIISSWSLKMFPFQRSMCFVCHFPVKLHVLEDYLAQYPVPTPGNILLPQQIPSSNSKEHLILYTMQDFNWIYTQKKETCSLNTWQKKLYVDFGKFRSLCLIEVFSIIPNIHRVEWEVILDDHLLYIFPALETKNVCSSPATATGDTPWEHCLHQCLSVELFTWTGVNARLDESPEVAPLLP